MSVDKVILKAFLTTLSAIAALLVFATVALCALFPSTSMELAYNMGMKSSCIHFAERAYKSSDDVYFIAYGTEVAIVENKKDKIVSCGEKFVADEEFEGYCALKEEGYKQFIYGRIGVAKYEKGDKESAVTFAYESLNGAFPEGNALVAVLLAAIQAADAETKNAVKVKLDQINVSGAEKEYLDETLAMIAD